MSVPIPHQAHPKFEGLKAWHYNLIMADPAWTWEAWSELGLSKSPQAQYDCMPLDLIKQMPVRELAWQNCLLWLWAHPAMVEEAYAVMREWGFEPKTMGFWTKRTTNGKLAFGQGHILRCAGEPFILGEPFLIGTTGKPATARNVRSVIEAPVIEGPAREHSRKPEECYDAAERLRPGPKADLFSRQSRKGWDSWGNEKTLFDELAEAA